VTGSGAAPADPPPPAGPAAQLAPLRWWQLAEVAALEPEVFDQDPWTPEMFWSELAQGSSRHYVVALVSGRIVGYAGLAVAEDESYIQTIGVHPGSRGRGVGALLMIALLREARRRGAHSCGLEVRTENQSAQALYARLGFATIGIRRGYYQPSGGDAFVMRVRPIDTAAYGAQLDAAEWSLAHRAPGPPATAPTPKASRAPDEAAAPTPKEGAR
jgi:ribosomal-protein-alanine N-acetyltransferase